MGTVLGAAAIAVGVAPVLVYLAVIGLAARSVLPRVLPGGLAVSVGLGAFVALPLITVGFVLFTILSPLIWGLLLLAVVLCVVAVVRDRALLGAWRGLVNGADLVGLVAAVGVLAAVLPDGRRYWTLGANDFPNYVGSVLVWFSQAGEGPDFLTRHPDVWGGFIAERASFEKPMVTTLMAIPYAIGRLHPAEQMPVMMGLSVAVTAGALAVLLKERYGLSYLWAGVAVLPSTFSAITVFRVYEAQVGQVVSLALLAVFVAAVPALGRVPRLRGADGVGVVLLLALGLTCILGTNASLVIGTAPAIGVLALWQLLAERLTLKVAFLRLLLVAALVLLLSAPLVPLYWHSLTIQGGAVDGYPIVWPTPLSLLGLENDQNLLLLAKNQIQEPGLAPLLAWGAVLLAVFMAWLGLRRRAPADVRLMALAGGLICANGVALLALYGVNSYNANKWLALVVPLVSPLLLGLFLAAEQRAVRHTAQVAFAYSAFAALVLAYQFGGRIQHHVSADTYALADSAELEAVDTLNIDIGPTTDLSRIFPSAIASFVAPSERVVLLSPLPELVQPPVGHMVLVNPEWTSRGGQVISRVRINNSYELQERRAPLPWGTTEVAQTPTMQDYLYGGWYPVDAGGVWSSSRTAYLSFDVPQDAEPGAPVRVILTGHRPQSPEQRDLQVRDVRAEGKVLASHVFDGGQSTDVEVMVPPESIRDGQVSLQLDAGFFDHEPDTTPPRPVRYFLESVTLEPVAGQN